MAAKPSSTTSTGPPRNHSSNNNSKKSIELVSPQPQQHIDVPKDNRSNKKPNDQQQVPSPQSSYNFDPCLNCGRYGIIHGQMILDANNNTFCGPNCGWSYLLGPAERERAVQAAALARLKSRNRRSRRRPSSSKQVSKDQNNSTRTQSTNSTNTTTSNNHKNESKTSRHRSRHNKTDNTKLEMSDEWLDQTMMNSIFESHLSLYTA